MSGAAWPSVPITSVNGRIPAGISSGARVPSRLAPTATTTFAGPRSDSGRDRMSPIARRSESMSAPRSTVYCWAQWVGTDSSKIPGWGVHGGITTGILGNPSIPRNRVTDAIMGRCGR